jgi:hypothetical protein
MPAMSDCGQYRTRGQVMGGFVTSNITAETAGIFKIGVNSVNRLGFGTMRVTGPGIPNI